VARFAKRAWLGNNGMLFGIPIEKFGAPIVA
jgi:hypothetical protein